MSAKTRLKRGLGLILAAGAALLAAGCDEEFASSGFSDGGFYSYDDYGDGGDYSAGDAIETYLSDFVVY
jgi:hypothetical protein